MKFKIAFAMLIALTFIMGGCANGPAAGSGGLNTLSSNPAVPTPAPVPDGVIADSVSGRFALYDGRTESGYGRFYNFSCRVWK